MGNAVLLDTLAHEFGYYGKIESYSNRYYDLCAKIYLVQTILDFPIYEFYLELNGKLNAITISVILQENNDNICHYAPEPAPEVARVVEIIKQAISEDIITNICNLALYVYYQDKASPKELDVLIHDVPSTKKAFDWLVESYGDDLTLGQKHWLRIERSRINLQRGIKSTDSGMNIHTPFNFPKSAYILEREEVLEVFITSMKVDCYGPAILYKVIYSDILQEESSAFLSDFMEKYFPTKEMAQRYLEINALLAK